MKTKKEPSQRKFKPSQKKEKKTTKKAPKWIKNLKFLSLTFALFLVAMGALFELPRGVSIAQTNILAAPASDYGQNSQQGEVAGVEAKPTIQILSKGIVAPVFTASSVLAEDFDSGEILYQKDIHKRLFPASTTKLMTALVSIDYFKMSDSLTAYPEDLVGGSVMGLGAGEKISYRSLLYGMLLNSGNDAAFTIAQNYPGGVTNFVRAMNDKTQNLGLLNTHFQNPAGFDDPLQYSSAYDLSKIALAASLNPEIAKVTSTKNATVYSFDNLKQHALTNVNQLLGEDGFIGMKTGYTEKAGENLVGLVDREGHKVLTVVLNSNDRFGETKQLADWAYQNYSWNLTQ